MNHSSISKCIAFFCSLAFTFQMLSCKSAGHKKESIATVNYSYNACFASGRSQLAIYKIDTVIFATIHTYTNEDITISVRTRLDQAQLDTFYLFAEGLKQFSNSNTICTTSQTYTLIIGNQKIQKTDNSCSWDGFDKIKNCLFRNVDLAL